MKVLTSCCILILAAGPLNSQEPKRSAVSVELGITSAHFQRFYSSDCCGTWEATGGALSIRIKRQTSRLLAVGVEAGRSLTPRPDMGWLMVIGTIAPKSMRLTPWAQAGAGLVSQQGECPADGPDTSPDCATAITLGGLIGAGVRWRLLHNLAVGLETAFVTGTPRGDPKRRFSTERYGVTLTLR
jgi:hypothetical protein